MRIADLLRPRRVVHAHCDLPCGVYDPAQARIEAESVEFHQRARAGFLDLAAADPDHYVVLDARAPVEEIADAVHARLRPLLEGAKQ